MDKPTLYMIAGEQSGDLHGSHLMRSLKRNNPHIQFLGVGGALMRDAGLTAILESEELEVMGITDVIKSIPKLRRLFHHVKNTILTCPPQAVILIDYPGFNIRMAQALRKEGYRGKIIQYIAPSVWAWGKTRIGKMEKTLDLLLTIYPFEKQCYSHTPLNVRYVGNPIAEYVRNYAYDNDWKAKSSLPPDAKILSIFPGSRDKEIERNLPPILHAAETLLKKHSDTIIALSCAKADHVKQIFSKQKVPGLFLGKNAFFVEKKFNYELMRDSHTALAKSGTVTLELALHEKPAVVVYKLTTLNRFVAKYWMSLSLPSYCIVNILNDAPTYPELIEAGMNSENISHHLNDLHSNEESRKRILERCKNLRQILASVNASEEAANAIGELL